IAVQFDVVQAEFACFDFQRILFIEVTKFFDISVTIQCVVVEVHFRVERVHFIVAGHQERIDLRERCIGILKCPVEPDHELHGIVDQFRGETQTKGETTPLKGLQAEARLDIFLQNEFGMLRGNLFDIHAARCGGHEYRFSSLSIDDDAQVELFPDIEPFFNEDLLYTAPFGSGLSSHEIHPDHPPRDFRGLVGRFCDLHASALPSSAGMNLRLDDNSAANPMSSLTRFVLCVSDLSAGNPDVVSRKNLLRLVLMYLHPVLTAKSVKSASWRIYRVRGECVNAAIYDGP